MVRSPPRLFFLGGYRSISQRVFHDVLLASIFLGREKASDHICTISITFFSSYILIHDCSV
jgi:hypothetical protein